MKRRVLLASLPLLGLAACAPDGGETEEKTAASPVENAEPVLVGERAELIDYTNVRLPLEMIPMIVVDPGWSSAPQQLDGIFLGYREEETHLRFLAVDQDGTVLWQADRPLDCTGFALTRGAEDTPVAVLADLGATSLTGYDLRTADTLWGPLEVPGPLVGPGLVHTASADGGSRTSLSGATGETLLREVDLDGGRLLGEHLGTAVQLAGSELRGSGADGEELWSLPLPDGIEPSEARLLDGIDTVTSFAVVADQHGHGAAIDLGAGEVIAPESTAVARDHTVEMTVVVSGTTVRGLEDDGTEKWTHEDPEPLRLVSAGAWLAYAVRPEEGSLVVLDTGRGGMVQPYDVDQEGPLAVPHVFSAEGAAAVRAKEQHFLVTTELDEEYGLREG